MNVLICLLGLSPGVVTGAYCALARDRGISIDRLVTVGTSADLADRCEREIVSELQRSTEVYPEQTQPEYDYDLGQPLTGLPRYDPAQDLADYRAAIKAALQTDPYGNARATPWCRLRIPYDDVTDAASATALRETLLVLVRDLYPQDEVYLCTAGGRKSMAAIAMLAAQLGPGVRRLFHIHNGEPRAETHGSVEDPDWPPWDDVAARLPFLRPRPDKLALVNIPFFRIQPGASGPELFVPMRGEDEEADRFVLEFLQQNAGWVVLDPSAEQELITAFFEERVRDWLENAGYEARRQPSPEWLAKHGIEPPLSKKVDRGTGKRRQNDIDVAGVKAGDVVIIECKAYLGQSTIPQKDLVQTRHLLNTRLQPGKRLHVWMATVAQDLYDPTDWELRDMERIEIWTTSRDIADAVHRANWGKKWRPLLVLSRGELRLARLARPSSV